MGENGTVSFALDAYDTTRPLVVDPAALIYSTFLGGSSEDHAQGITVDAKHNAYIVGTTGSTDFPKLNPYQSNKAGDEDVFVTKLNADGTALVFSTFIGGTDFQQGLDIALDNQDHVYVTGETASKDFPVTPGAFQSSLQGFLSANAFVSKLSADGTTLLYSTYLGGGQDVARSIAVLDQKAFVTGTTGAVNFPTKNAFQTDQGDNDAFVSAFDTTQSGAASLLWSTYLGGSGIDDGNSIAVVRRLTGLNTFATEVVVAGATDSNDFPTKNPIQGNQIWADGFVTKFTGAGKLIYSTYLGGGDYDNALAVAMDAQGNAYVAGHTWSIDLPTTFNAFQKSCGLNAQGKCQQSMGFVAKINTAGSAFVYLTYLGSTNAAQQADAIAVDRLGNAYVEGYTSSTNFPTTPGALDTQCGTVTPCDDTHNDVFVTELDSTGSALMYSTYLGGDDNDMPGYSHSIAVDGVGGVYVTGETLSTDFPHYPDGVYDPGCGTDGTCNAAGPAAGVCGNGTPCTDAFVVKFSTAADLSVKKTGDVGTIKLSGNNIVTYSIVVRDNGPAAAGVFELQDVLSSKAAFKIVSVNLGPSTPGMCLIQNVKNIYCKITQLPVGGEATVTLRVQALSLPGGFSTPLWDKATVKLLNQMDPNQQNNSATVTTTIMP
ncbi:MAG: SBBP repeat-containing protein, partial [Anaerolineae bacterium]